MAETKLHRKRNTQKTKQNRMTNKETTEKSISNKNFSINPCTNLPRE